MKYTQREVDAMRKTLPPIQFYPDRVEADPHGLSLDTPGAKADSGKALAGVLLDFSHALSAVVDVGTMGAHKYSRGGWLSVPEGERRYTDAMLRHLLKHGAGETHDAESGLPHLAHLAWNALAILQLTQRPDPQA